MNCKPAPTLVPGHGSKSYLKPGMLTGEQKIIDLLVAIHPGATGIDLRGQTRLRVQFRGVFSTGVSMVGGEGVLQDLSHYGCRMESDTSLQPGTELELCFFYGSREAVPIRVEARHGTVGHRPGVRGEIPPPAIPRGSTPPPGDRRAVSGFTPVEKRYSIHWKSEATGGGFLPRAISDGRLRYP